MATVYRATDLKHDRAVAVKVCEATGKGGTTMRTLLGVVALPCALALAGATPAPANHAYAWGVVHLYRGQQLLSEYGSQQAPCTGNECPVTVALGKPDYGRFVKWCGSASRDLSVAADAYRGALECKGPSDWKMIVEAAMYDAQRTVTTHAEIITITVTVTP